MKFLFAILLTALIGFIGGLYLPWWSIAIAAFLVAAMVHQKAGKAFIAGFLGIFLLWAVLAFWINIKNEGILATKIASVLPLGGSDIVLILVTGLIGGLIGGSAALGGSFLRATKA